MVIGGGAFRVAMNGTQPTVGGHGTAGRAQAARRLPFPAGFFERYDDEPDAEFYEPLRLVTHLDDGAIAEVGRLYTELGLDGDVLDLMSSWVSHFGRPPASLTALGMNAGELARNPAAHGAVVHDLNADPRPAVRRRHVRRARHAVCRSTTSSTRSPCSPTSPVCCDRAGCSCARSPTAASRPKRSVAGWRTTTEVGWRSCETYFHAERRRSTSRMWRIATPGAPGDPLYAVWAARRPG